VGEGSDQRHGGGVKTRPWPRSWRISCDKRDWKRERDRVVGVSASSGCSQPSGFAFCEDQTAFAKRAEQKYQEARKKFQNSTNDAEAAWQFAAACFDWADFAKDDDQRESVANEGIAACRQLIARDPKSVAGHYYLAMDLGQLAQNQNAWRVENRSRNGT